jgi:23S rRNA (cytosine1962-C5)-methyltransferase
MVFGKTTEANRSLTEQFSAHSILKRYILATDRKVVFERQSITSSLVRVGEKYESRPLHKGGEEAETEFRKILEKGNITLLEAIPKTGKTHQIRSHAAALNIPILGDVLYGGTTAHRVHLHAGELDVAHPATGKRMVFTVPYDFTAENSHAIRKAFVDTTQTNAYRVVNGASDCWPELFVEVLGDYLIAQSPQTLSEAQSKMLASLLTTHGLKGVYHKTLLRHVRKTTVESVSPQLVMGDAAPGDFTIIENGVSYEMSFNEGYSVGLFLDQRDNRRRILTNHVAGGFPVFAVGASSCHVLNTFSYTCGFSVCAARAGAITTSLDLSKKYLDWGRRNFALNGLDHTRHDFIFGDVFDWMHRLHKKGRVFDLVILDPPTFSQSKQTGRFSAEKDYGKLMELTLPLLKSGGVILASTNAAKLEPEVFISNVTESITCAGRKIMRQHYAPQPPDFPVSREEPAYLKTLWMQVG